MQWKNIAFGEHCTPQLRMQTEYSNLDLQNWDERRWENQKIGKTTMTNSDFKKKIKILFELRKNNFCSLI